MKTKFLNTRYTLMQASYWSVFCALNGYAAVYLDGKGFSAGQTGSILAAANIIAAFLQPAAAAKADRQGKFSLKEITVALGVLCMLASVLMCLPNRNFWMVCALFAVGSVSIQSLQPMVNAVSMYYYNRGENMNFGLARGTGSIAYAGVSYVIGILTSRLGVTVVPAVAVISLVIFLGIALSFRIQKTPQEGGEGQRTSSSGFAGILKQYPRFGVLLLGIIFMFVFHFFTNTYMFQMVQAVGGDSSHMGMAVSIAAISELPVMFFFSKIVERIPIKKLLRFAGVLWFVKAVIFCFCTSVLGIYLTQILQMLAYGLYIPASVYYANQLMDEKNKVKGQAMVTMAFTVGSVFGNFLGGKLIDWYGVREMLIVGAVCTAIGAVLFFIGTGADEKR
ncbi:MAG: MFS transporter [Candidatus Limivivens sp.]|nr:MFS transporter [Candidatus Limivivens sp.]